MKNFFHRCGAVFMVLIIVTTAGCGGGREPSGNEADGIPSLADSYESEFLIGVALGRSEAAGEVPRATPLITRHFNSITPENLLKWERVHPEPGRYNVGPSDQYVEFGESNGMVIVGHTLVWHNQVPEWVFRSEDGGEINREALLQRMEDHITTVIGRYRGRIDGWDVVNEAVLDNGEVRSTRWYELIGPDYVEKAFQFARTADPEAELYYNDYNLWKPAKREAVIKLVRRLQQNGIRVDGIGMQAHLDIDYPPVSMIEKSIEAFAELGVNVMITELDIDVLPDEDDVDAEIVDGGTVPPSLDPYRNGLSDSVQQQLTHRYTELFRLFRTHDDKITRVTFWGLDDGHSWLNNFPIRGRTNYPLLFDRTYQPKPALDAIIRLTNQQ
ncbi:MAG: endo-1,4-beta-xylanase [Balneolaceae bacterium]|nr:endo-1,4-beta-xylanase [Balneolaceae bacterium]